MTTEELRKLIERLVIKKKIKQFSGICVLAKTLYVNNKLKIIL